MDFPGTRLVDGLVSCVAPRGWRKVQMAVHQLHQGAGDHRGSWGRGALSLTYRSVGPRGIQRSDSAPRSSSFIGEVGYGRSRRCRG